MKKIFFVLGLIFLSTDCFAGNSAKEIRTVFNPVQLPSVVGHYDSLESGSLFQNDDGTTASTSNGHNVKFWTDLSGNGNNVAASSSNPQLEIINTIPTVAFDSTDRLQKNIASASQTDVSIHCLLRSRVDLSLTPYFSFNSSGQVPFLATRWTTNGMTVYFTSEQLDSSIAEDKNWHYIAVTRSASSIKVYGDGVLLSTLSVAAAPTVDAIVLGAAYAYSGTSVNIAALTYANAEHSASDVATYYKYLRNRFYKIYPKPAAAVVFEGNSLFSGGYVSNQTQTIPYLAANGLTGTDYWFDTAVSGRNTATMVSEFSTRTNLFLDSITDGSKRVLVIWEGTNDIVVNGANATTAYNNLVAYCTAAQAAGWKVIVGTILPRHTDVDETSFNATRNTVNTNLRNNWEDFANALWDPASDSDIGDDGDSHDTTFYLDGIHLNVLGNSTAEAAGGDLSTLIESFLD